MANGGAEIQVDKGEYARIHNAILEKLAWHDFSSREYACILYLLRMTYGWNRKDCRLSNGDFAKATHLDRTAIIKTLRRLVERNVISKNEGDPYHAATWRFNKYFEQWDAQTSVKTTTSVEMTSSQNDTSTSGYFDTTSSSQIDTTSSVETTTSYISAKDNKDTIKDSVKDRGHQPAQSSDYIGMNRPFRSERVTADGYTQDAAKNGIDAASFRAIFDLLIDAAGWRGLVDAGSNRELNWAKESALTLIRLGNITPEHIERLVDAYRKANDWRNTPPKPKDLAEYASQLQAGVLNANGRSNGNGRGTSRVDKSMQAIDDFEAMARAKGVHL
jgi:phage replication O-like protein O